MPQVDQEPRDGRLTDSDPYNLKLLLHLRHRHVWRLGHKTADLIRMAGQHTLAVTADLLRLTTPGCSPVLRQLHHRANADIVFLGCGITR